DSLGNNYITGSSRGDLGGSKDVFLVKHNSDGVFQWTRQWGTNEDEDSLATVVDSSDNIYVSGHSAGDLDGYANLGSSDLFLTKYSASGVFQWTSHMGTAAQDRIYGMAVNNTDEIFITGQTYGDLDGNTNAGNDDMILAKFNSSGELQ
ncbi:MAG: hypothetical protein GY753_09025, partial [Gammaproteobacteria bacterium]|nr:hypothetical protein [Gammaproteobacteria bacterium]